MNNSKIPLGGVSVKCKAGESRPSNLMDSVVKITEIDQEFPAVTRIDLNFAHEEAVKASITMFLDELEIEALATIEGGDYKEPVHVIIKSGSQPGGFILGACVQVFEKESGEQIKYHLNIKIEMPLENSVTAHIVLATGEELRKLKNHEGISKSSS